MTKTANPVNLRAGIPWLTGFLFMTVIALLLRTPETVGRYLLLLTVAWVTLFFGWARTTNSILLQKILIFSAVLSVFQVFPDWVLSRCLGVLVFPPDGLFKWDTVSGYMALLWAIPASQILVAYFFAKERWGNSMAYAAGILVGAILFIGSEELLWMLPSWYAVNVVKWGHVARYIILPEILLSFMIIFVFCRVEERSLLWYACGAATVSLVYTAAAVLSYHLMG
jgi:hypothetical protein